MSLPVTSPRATFEGGFSGKLDDSETDIANVRVYVFNSVGVLETMAEFTPGATLHIFQSTTGNKSIFAITNMETGSYPSTPAGQTSHSAQKVFFVFIDFNLRATLITVPGTAI